MTAPPLLYNGKSMSAEPINSMLAYVQATLRDGYPITVRLEPGDATRYDLTVAPNPSGGVSVIRHTGEGPCYAHHVYLNEWYEDLEEVLLPLGHGNPWSAKFLAWWLRQALGWAPQPAEAADPAPAGSD